MARSLLGGGGRGGGVGVGAFVGGGWGGGGGHYGLRGSGMFWLRVTALEEIRMYVCMYVDGVMRARV